MGTIMIEPDPEMHFKKLLDAWGAGCTCAGQGRQTSGENFTFDAAWGYEVRKGRLGRMLRGINIMGNLFDAGQYCRRR